MEFLIQCCVCKQYKVNNKWQKEKPFECDNIISHIYCSSCLREERKKIDKYFEDLKK